ncbi:MAG TPA: response regulator transcription factor [Geobacteraceae bacterium]
MKLLLVEDNTLTREALQILLAGEQGIEIVGSCETAEEALSALAQVVPDVMVVDLDLPGMSGIELTRLVKRSHPAVEVMAFTVFEDRDTVFAAIKAGASSYLLKGSSPRELVEAITSLQQGGAPMSPKIARKLIREFQAGVESTENSLSHREKVIVRSVEQGLTYKEIADRLCISPHTVHTHIKNIYEKLQVKDRQSAIMKARRQGIL